MSLKDQMEHELKAPIRLRAGAPGALDVYLNGEQIYSKKKMGRMPSARELIGLIRDRVTQS